jgi:hypothetical protein
LGGVLKERFEGRGWTLVYFLHSSSFFCVLNNVLAG